MSLFTRLGRAAGPRPTSSDDDQRVDDLKADDPREPEPRRGRARRVARSVTTVLAGLLVLLALITPSQFTRLTPEAFVRIPVEGLLGIALLVYLPPKPRKVVAGLAGALLGVLTIFKGFDIGFDAVLVRPFDPVLDSAFLQAGLEFFTGSFGRVGGIAAVIGVVALALVVVVFMTLSTVRLARLAAGHQRATTGALAVLGTAWVTFAALGAELVPGVPIASDSAAVLAYDHARQIPASLHDRQVFAKEASVDAFRTTPGSDLLTALRGKDVILAYVESYGRSVLEDPQYAPKVDAVLDAGTRRLQAAGYSSRSAFLTSSTAGGGSWLAHATLDSGLWINNQQRYRTLTSSDRMTVNRAFGKAGWRTLTLQPAITRAWPEARFFGYDHVYDANNAGYRGPRFSFATMPDQYTLSVLQRAELDKQKRSPVMAEIAFVSSHAPWASIPTLVDWNKVGDGSIFNGMGKGYNAPWPAADKIRGEYRRSIEYTLNTLVSYMETQASKNTVLIFLGDHQPAPYIAGANSGRDVPITIVSHDKAVTDRIAPWGWQDGLRPGKQAPVWPMSAFRDRFLTAFSPQTQPGAAHR